MNIAKIGHIKGPEIGRRLAVTGLARMFFINDYSNTAVINQLRHR